MQWIISTATGPARQPHQPNTCTRQHHWVNLNDEKQSAGANQSQTCPRPSGQWSNDGADQAGMNEHQNGQTRKANHRS